MKTKLRPRIGLLPTGLQIYWEQYPRLRERGLAMYDKLVEGLSEFGEVFSPGLVDNDERAEEAAKYLKAQDVDILLIFPFGYTTGASFILDGGMHIRKL